MRRDTFARARGPALAAVVVAAVGSLGFMVRVGQHQQSVMLMALFAGWVLAPYLGALAVAARSTRWSPRRRAALHGMMIVIALASLSIYAWVAFTPTLAKPARFFLLVPLASCLALAATYFTGGGNAHGSSAP